MSADSEFVTAGREFTGPWAPTPETEQNSIDCQELTPLLKKRRTEQLEMRIEEPISKEKELDIWREIKLAALRRVLEFTRKTEFVDADQHAIQTKLEMLEACWAEYGDACRNWLSMINDPEHMCLAQGEEIYFAAKAEMRSRLAVLTPQATVQTNQPENNVVQIQWSDMPSQDKLPTFAGDFAKWASFRDAFIAEVHNNKKLTNAQRLRKLLASLEGAAKRAVGEWSVANDENYLLAWSSLRQQYDNNHQTIRAHMQEVSGLQQIREKSFEDLREVLDTVRVNRRHLLSLLTTEQLVDYQFLHQIEQLLDADGRREWEMRRRVNELPSLSEMFAFVEQRANCLASLAISTNAPRAVTTGSRDESRVTQKSSISTTQRTSGTAPSTTMNNNQGRRSAAQTNEQKRSADTRKCFKCELPGHAMFHCDQFKAMQLNDRREFVQKKRLCESCFSPNHLSAACRREPCPHPPCAGQKHNSTICPSSSRPKSEGTVAQASVSAGTP